MGNSISSAAPPSALPYPTVYEIEESQEKVDRTLRHLIRANHHTYAVLYHNLQFHNHLPHILCSAYAIKADPVHLNHLYEIESAHLERWTDAPGEVTGGDWRDYLGEKEYQRAFLDFFEDELVKHSYDWKAVLFKYLLEGDEPLVNGLMGGLGHPLIHLGYALEFENRELAMEALTLASTSYSFLHKYIDQPAPTVQKADKTPLQVLDDIQQDKRLDGLFTSPGNFDFEKLMKEKEDVVLEYFQQLTLPPEETLSKVLHGLVKAATALLTATSQYDFFLVHTLTTSFALRVVLPFVDSKHQVNLLRSHWLFLIVVYITQLRPKINSSKIDNFDLKGRDWSYVLDAAKWGRKAEDAHFVKAARALKVYGELWEEEACWFLKAGVKFAEEFREWGGFEGEASKTN